MDDQPVAADGLAVHDVHALASEAAEFEASVNRFLDEALISDFQTTPLHTLDDVLDARREKEEQRLRVQARAKELMADEVAKDRHERELRDLAEAISVTNEPSPAVGARTGKRSPTEGEGEEAVPAAPFKLEGAGRSRQLKPYMANTSEFTSEHEASRHIDGLQKENELLRKCLQGSRTPGAFDTYLHAKTTL